MNNQEQILIGINNCIEEYIDKEYILNDMLKNKLNLEYDLELLIASSSFYSTAYYNYMYSIFLLNHSIEELKKELSCLLYSEFQLRMELV
jgi:hypothetical protein